MSDLAVIAEPNALDQYADPATTVVLACERAKEWLAVAAREHDIEDIVTLKAQAEAIRVYTTTKQLGRDAELAATEIIRRAERGIGLAIRRGQDEGTIARRQDVGPMPPYVRADGTPVAGSDRGCPVTDVKKTSPSMYLSGGKTTAETYAMTDDVTDEDFEQAIEEAKAESNLSRANVVRKVKGAPAPKPTDRHEIHHRARHINPVRIIEETVAALEGIASGLALIEDYSSLDAEKRLEWLEALRQPLAAINRFKKELSR